ncbi:MAG: ComEA family DNA-binding protein, partial [Acidimicrobiia bacterium]
GAVGARGGGGGARRRPGAGGGPAPAAAPAPAPAPPTPPGADRAAAPAGPAGPAQVVVHAAGALNRPGVYRLDAGARVDDVVAAAGGLAPGADADRLNLASPVADGERVYVPRLGQEAPATVGNGPSASSGRPAPAVALNTATVGELDALPGIGPTTAAAIVAFRDQHGPFGSVDELLDVRGIGPAKLDQLRPLVGL